MKPDKQKPSVQRPEPELKQDHFPCEDPDWCWQKQLQKRRKILRSKEGKCLHPYSP